MWNSEGFYDRILEGWERSETEDGTPYYINHRTEITQWDHPLFVKIMEELVDMNNVRYAAYRTAMKLRFIQKRLRLDLIELSSLTTLFHRHGYTIHGDTVLDCPKLYSLLLEMYQTARHTSNTERGVSETTAELLLNFLLNLFDKDRRGYLRVMAVKLALGTLCAGKLTEKYRYFYQQICDKNNHVSRKKLGIFLHDVLQLADIINESHSFGGFNVAPAVDSCFAVTWGSFGLNEDEFVSWMLKEPQTIVWLPTLHRLAAAESVKHESKCNICKVYPIIGFRYKCLKCFNFDMCSECFFVGRETKKHKLKHPTQEYCVSSSTKEDTKAFMRTVRNNLSKKHRNKKKLRYLPIYGTDQPYDPMSYVDDIEVVDNLHTQGGSQAHHSGSEGALPSSFEDDTGSYDEVDAEVEQLSHNLHGAPYSLPEANPRRAELDSILYHMEDENRGLMREIERLQLESPTSEASETYSSSSSRESENLWLRDERERLRANQEVLAAHNKQLETQLQRLRVLVKDTMQPTPATQVQPKHAVPNRSPAYREPLSLVDQNRPSVMTPMDQSRLQHSSSIDRDRHNPVHHESPQTFDQSRLQPQGAIFKEQPSAPPSAQPIRHPRQAPPSFGTPINQTTPLKQSMPVAAHSSRRRSGFTPRRSLYGTPESIDDMFSDATPDATLGHTRFTLPSPNMSRAYPDEEEELQNMIDRINATSQSELSDLQVNSTMDEVYRAANKIGDAMTGFVAPSGYTDS